MPYAILSLPRSRTFWLSRLFGCDHDPSRRFASRSEAIQYLNSGANCIDTALGLIWHELVPALRPDLQVAVIHRPLPDVLESTERLGISCRTTLEVLAERLMRLPVHHFTYSQMATYDGCARLSVVLRNQCLDYGHWRDLADEHMECDMLAYRREMMANAAGVAAVFGGVR